MLRGEVSLLQGKLEEEINRYKLAAHSLRTSRLDLLLPLIPLTDQEADEILCAECIAFTYMLLLERKIEALEMNLLQSELKEEINRYKLAAQFLQASRLDLLLPLIPLTDQEAAEILCAECIAFTYMLLLERKIENKIAELRVKLLKPFSIRRPLNLNPTSLQAILVNMIKTYL